MIERNYNIGKKSFTVYYDSFEFIRVDYIDENGNYKESGKHTVIETAKDEDEYIKLRAIYDLAFELFRKCSNEDFVQYTSCCFGVKEEKKKELTSLFYIIGHLSIYNKNTEL